jgi:hypothetical protein
MNRPVIEKGIPLPSEKNKMSIWREWLVELEVGDSFAVPEKVLTVSNYTSRASKEMSRKFVCRTIEDGRTRVWRSL